MLIYDMLDHKFTNQSGPDDTPRAEGVMLYVPAGDAGLMVYFGGIQMPFNNSTITAVRNDSLFDFGYQLTSSVSYDSMFL